MDKKYIEIELYDKLRIQISKSGVQNIGNLYEKFY